MPGMNANLSAMSPRLFRVHGSNYWHDEITESPATHTDAKLADVARLGFDSVWLHGELKQLCPLELFGAWEPDAAGRLAALRVTVERAAKHGLGVWLYLNEPRAYPQDHPFWAAHPECRGALCPITTARNWREGHGRAQHYALCLSAQPVRDYLRQAAAALARAVPGLAGVLLITASEHHGHCFARHRLDRDQPVDCPRCAGRQPWEMPAEVARAMLAGFDEAGSAMRLCCWTWSWHRHLDPAPCSHAIAALPPRAEIMSVFEMGGSAQRGSTTIDVDEYSLGEVGPTPLFMEQAAQARAQQRPLWAKLQLTATHELATVPNLPVPGAIYDKLAACRAQGVTGIMSVWTMALRPTLCSYAAGQLMAHAGALPPRAAWLRTLAREYFTLTDEHAVDQVVTAWAGFGAALAQHPMETNFLYFSPMNYAPAFPWHFPRQMTPMARSWTPEPWGDRLEMSVTKLTLAQAATLLEEMALRWATALLSYQAALTPAARTNRHAEAELHTALACKLWFACCARAYRFVVASESGAGAPTLLELIDAEAVDCQAARQLIARDPRQGWHDDVGPMVTAELIDAKLTALAALRQKLAGG